MKEGASEIRIDREGMQEGNEAIDSHIYILLMSIYTPNSLFQFPVESVEPSRPAYRRGTKTSRGTLDQSRAVLTGLLDGHEKCSLGHLNPGPRTAT